MVKKDDIVTCINLDSHEGNGSKYGYITLNKQYTITESSSSLCIIINDDGKTYRYPKSNFKLISDWD